METVEKISSVPKEVNDFVDGVEKRILDLVGEGELELIHIEPKHTFTKGLYGRKVILPPFKFFTSEIHLTEHQFVILKGTVTVYDSNRPPVILTAPYDGVTLAGTRRMVETHEEEVIWMTFHATDVDPVDDSEEAKEAAAEKVHDLIIEKRDNPLLSDTEKELLLNNK